MKPVSSLLNTLALLSLLCFAPVQASACSACFGQSDSSMARGMTFGIFTLLAVVVVTLAGIASFFVYLAHRADALAKTRAASLDPNQR